MPNIKEMPDDEFERLLTIIQGYEGVWETLSPSLTIADRWEYPTRMESSIPPRAFLDNEVLKVGSIVEVAVERLFIRRKLYRRWREGVITGIDFGKGKIYVSIGDAYSTGGAFRLITLSISDDNHEPLIRWPKAGE